MDQDIEVALRITEAIVATYTGTPADTEGGRAGALAEKYVDLFREVHVKVKEYLDPALESASSTVTPVTRIGQR